VDPPESGWAKVFGMTFYFDKYQPTPNRQQIADPAGSGILVRAIQK
jgi:hypothetical protein